MTRPGARASSPSDAMLPLQGVRVIVSTRVLAVPLCTQTLGTLGAEVIKVESVDDGDEMRQWPPLHGDTGAPFLSYNRNKKGIALQRHQRQTATQSSDCARVG